MIDFTFPQDTTETFLKLPLAGVACTGGRARLDHAYHQEGFLEFIASSRLVVEFATRLGTGRRNEHPVVVAADLCPELFALARDQVLRDFGPASGFGITRASDGWFHVHHGEGEYAVSKRRAALVEGVSHLANAVRNTHDLPSLPERQESWAHFAMVDHPEFGVIGVLPIEYHALQLPECIFPSIDSAVPKGRATSAPRL